jgi:hypothetical protein
MSISTSCSSCDQRGEGTKHANEMMSRSDKPHYSNTFPKSARSDCNPWPISAGELASLVDLGLSDNRIARYFGVEPAKVSALRAYYGLVDSERLTESGA